MSSSKNLANNEQVIDRNIREATDIYNRCFEKVAEEQDVEIRRIYAKQLEVAGERLLVLEKNTGERLLVLEKNRGELLLVLEKNTGKRLDIQLERGKSFIDVREENANIRRSSRKF